MSRLWTDSPHKGSELLLLLAVADNANDDGVAWPSQETLAAKTRLSVRQVRRLTDLLVKAGALTIEDRRHGSTTRRVYRFPSPGQDVLPNERSPGHPGSFDPDIAVSAEPSEDQPPEELVEPSGSTVRKEQVTNFVQAVWKAYAPPLIAHRDSYMAERSTRAAVERALKRYPCEVVTEAIRNYVTVLGGTQYRWDHRWTLVDFLKRGLDRFVPEADPLNNFRIKPDGMKYGRRDVSPRELFDLADRLEADERKALEPG
jgi:Helix-turn-helix domain